MKKFRVLAVFLMVATLLSGCSMKTDFGMTIKADKKVTIAAIMAMDNEAIDSMLDMANMGSENASSGKHTDKERWAYIEETLKDDENEDLNYEKYEEGNYKGYKLTSESGDIDEVTKATASAKVNFANYFDGTGDDSPAMFVKDGNYYVSNITFDTTDSESLGQINSYQSYLEMFEFKFFVTLPNKPVSNNADSVSSDGKTLTWDLTKGAKDIEFKFSFDGAKDPEVDPDDNPIFGKGSSNKKKSSDSKEDKKDNTLLYVGCAAGAGVLVGAAIIVFMNKKKK